MLTIARANDLGITEREVLDVVDPGHEWFTG